MLGAAEGVDAMTAWERAAMIVDRLTDGMVDREPETIIVWITEQILAHTEAVREKDARIAQHYVCGCGDHGDEVARLIRAREVQ